MINPIHMLPHSKDTTVFLPYDFRKEINIPCVKLLNSEIVKMECKTNCLSYNTVKSIKYGSLNSGNN